jgi:hypothetical protein
VKPNLTESLAMAGSAQDFRPHSALIISSDEAEANRIKSSIANPARVLTLTQSGGTSQWFQNKQVADAAFQWLKETF